MPSRYVVASIAYSIPGIGGLLAAEPVATIISSAEISENLLISLLSLTVTDELFIARLYHSIKSRSFSLNEGAAASINIPPSLSVFS